MEREWGNDQSCLHKTLDSVEVVGVAKQDKNET